MKTYCEDCGRAGGAGHIPSCIGRSVETLRAEDEFLHYGWPFPWEAHLDRFADLLHEIFRGGPETNDAVIDGCLRVYVAECRAIEDREDRCL